MRSYFAPAITLAMIMPAILSARSDDIPTLDVRPVCRGIASQSALEVGLQQTSFEQCVQSEQAVREEVKKEWSTFSAADKSHCVALAKNFNGVQNGVTNGLLFPASPAFSPDRKTLYVTNLELDLTKIGITQSVDSQWAAEVKQHSIAKLSATIPPLRSRSPKVAVER